ncbi:DUF6542 domain-containing protein [Rhodococcus cercidiphylli]|uniref:DUF6542 domain-containing protein n=1 Tax=Rhodococcus cercidiphylli TaxID=489916 RepID=A0ABU4AYR3_9NOCA|nr:MULTISPECIES: DUF6542 domain-containing protein [Rhodococcus]MDI6629849.1 hypothetical protein [Rhodococcus sp. (in: high G+C Gram-positive bacteria)]MDV6231341.1 DUF6542 domain-containing protein [Rhodococcus cercidiphylli]
MSTSQRARSGVPLDHRSILATLPGVPAWGAVAIAAGLTFLGFLIDAARGTELTGAFAFMYVLGCIAGVLLVRFRGLFTAMVQAPLILFVAVPLSYQYFTDNAGTSLKDIILNVAIPLVNRFPLMLLGTLVAVGLGVLRIVLKRQNTHAPAVRRSPKPSDDKPTRAQRRAQEERPERSRRRAAAADRSTDSAAEATDIVPGPYVGRRSTDPRPRSTPRTGSRAAADPTVSPRRSATPTSAPQTRYSADAPRQDHKPEHQKPEYPRTQYPQAESRDARRPQPSESRYAPEPRYSAEPRYSTEPRRERSTRVKAPREAADPYGTGARPVVTPRTSAPAGSAATDYTAGNSQGSHSLPDPRRDDIPPHPVPKVRYRDRHSD